MIYTKVDKTYLRLYMHKVHNLDSLKRLKFELLESCGVKAYDIEKIEVNLQGKKLSQQEQTILRVRKINVQIAALEADLKPLQEHLNRQIDEVNSISRDCRHAEILRMLYLEGFTMKDVILNYYTEDTKTTRSNIEGLRNTACKLLAKTKGIPFTKVYRYKVKDKKELEEILRYQEKPIKAG